jgi:hypothetical protein
LGQLDVSRALPLAVVWGFCHGSAPAPLQDLQIVPELFI